MVDFNDKVVTMYKLMYSYRYPTVDWKESVGCRCSTQRTISPDHQAEAGVAGWVEPFRILWAPQTCPTRRRKDLEHDAQRRPMAAGAGDHLMLSRLGLGEDNAEKAGSSTLLLHENVVSFRRRRYPPISAPGARVCLLAAAGHRRLLSNRLARDTSAARWAVAMAHRPPACSARR